MKLCTYCNFENDDDTLFCSECGSSLKEMVFCTECGNETDANEAFCMHCNANIISDDEVVIPVTTEKNNDIIKNTEVMVKENPTNSLDNNSILIKVPKIKLDKGLLKKNKKWLFGMVGIAALVLIFTYINPMQFFSAKDIIIYQKDNELNISRISNLTPLEITKKLWNDEESISLVDIEFYGTFLSADMKTLYFMDKVDEDTASFYMMKIKSSKLEKNEAIKVDTDIYQRSAYMTKDGKKFIYIVESDKTLMIYNQEESFEIDDEVTTFKVNDDEKSMYYFKEDGSIYYVSLNSIDETNKITSSHSVYKMDRSGNLYYLKDDKLYLSKLGTDSEKIDSDVFDIRSATANGVYYIKEIQNEEKLSNYVNDDMKENDASMVMPVEPDVNNYYEKVLVDTYYGSRWQEKLNTEKYYADVDFYNAEMYSWTDKGYRDDLRAELNTSTLTMTSYSLYYYDSTTEVLITDQYDTEYYSVSAYNINALIYSKYDNATIEKVNLSQINSLSEVEDTILSSTSNSEELFVSYAGSEITLEQDSATACTTSDNAIFLFGNFDPEDRVGDLSKITFDKDGNIENETIDDEVIAYDVLEESNSVIYYKDLDGLSATVYLDGIEIASDVHLYSVYNIDDSDTFLYLKDYEDLSGTLCLLKNDEEIEIADDVNRFSYVYDKHIFFLVDYSVSDESGDLMMFDGKDVIKVDSEVQHLISGRNRK